MPINLGAKIESNPSPASYSTFLWILWISQWILSQDRRSSHRSSHSNQSFGAPEENAQKNAVERRSSKCEIETRKNEKFMEKKVNSRNELSFLMDKVKRLSKEMKCHVSKQNSVKFGHQNTEPENSRLQRFRLSKAIPTESPALGNEPSWGSNCKVSELVNRYIPLPKKSHIDTDTKYRGPWKIGYFWGICCQISGYP